MSEHETPPSHTDDRQAIVQALIEEKIIGIVRVDSEQVALRIAEALLTGGVRAIEVTFTTPGAEKVIETIRTGWPEALVGAGTIRDESIARRAIAAGAQYIVSPGIAPGVVETAHKHDVPAMLGVMTPTEAMRALDIGADVLKLFPATALGPDYLKALRAPLPDALWCPTGGLTLDNYRKWIAAGAAFVGVGGPLLGDVAKTEDYAALVARARTWAALR